MNDVLLVLNASQIKPPQAEKSATVSPHYPHLSALHLPQQDDEPLLSLIRNEITNITAMIWRDSDDKCVGDRKGEEHEYDHYQGPPPRPAVTLSALANITTAFRAEDIGYFNSRLDEAYGNGDIIHLGIHLFLGQAKSVAIVKGPYLIQMVLHTCLRGDATGMWRNCQIYSEMACTEASTSTTESKP